MAKVSKILIITILTLTILAILIPNKIYAKSIEVSDSVKIATGILNPDDYEPQYTNIKEMGTATDRTRTIVSIIRTVGVVISVISLMALGLKYMTGSVSEKAEYKKTMIPYLIGTIMLFAITQLVALIASFFESLGPIDIF